MHFFKKGQKNRAWVDPLPPHSGNVRKKKFFFLLMSSLSLSDMIKGKYSPSEETVA